MSCSVNPIAIGSAIRPPPKFFSPMWIKPFKKVPFVNTTVRAVYFIPIRVITPFTSPFSTINCCTESCQKSTFKFPSNAFLHSSAKRIRSDWQRGDHIAGPLERFNILNWIMVLSEMIPDIPPSASISLTIWPFATPPIAGLQDIWAIVCIFIVTNKTRDPICAAA